jgi:DNA-binding transcriptional ArsR family regulator
MSPFEALRDPTRRQILKLLRHGSKNAGEIADEFQLSAPTMSHHLKVLRAAGLVRVERRGTSLVYTLQSNIVEDVVSELLGMLPGKRAVAKPRRASS